MDKTNIVKIIVDDDPMFENESGSIVIKKTYLLDEIDFNSSFGVFILDNQ